MSVENGMNQIIDKIFQQDDSVIEHITILLLKSEIH